MRRSEKAITDPNELEKIIRAGRVCRLALAAAPAPYIVPLNFGYQAGALYFHSAPEGRKIDLLRQQPQAGFEISLDLGLVEGNQACNWSARYRSVLGHGRVEFIAGEEEKRRALDLIMAQYAPGEFNYPAAAIRKTTIFRLVIDHLSGKQSTP
jgi:nitroimidazol reductase NimA-like FMN-containing flavoprotein (pyridoxamine 5'-phosphate oxidase superfamily)